MTLSEVNTTGYKPQCEVNYNCQVTRKEVFTFKSPVSKLSGTFTNIKSLKVIPWLRIPTAHDFPLH